MPTRLMIASAVLAATALACGGDDASPQATPSATQTTTSPTPSPTPAALSKSEFVSQVLTICTRVETEANKIGEPKTADDYAAAMTSLAGIIERANDDVAKLVPPPADVAGLQANFFGPNEMQEATFKAALPDLQSAAQSDDLAAAEKAFGEAINANPTTEAQEKFIKDYGLGDCI